MAVASSEENEDFSARRVADNAPSTRWSSMYTDEQWIYVDLGSLKQISRIRLVWEGAYALEYEVLCSTDMENWEVIQRISNGRPGPVELERLSVKARYVKINCLQRGSIYGYSLWELAVFNDQVNIDC
nr:discoidin domain-containing protein [Paenibacillus dendritiformis]